jgi:hypothetical protein
MAKLGDVVDAEVGAEGSGLREVAGPTAMLLRGLAGAPVRRSGVAAAARSSAPGVEVAGWLRLGLGLREVGVCSAGEARGWV